MQNEITKKVNELRKLICGESYDCDADWCPLEASNNRGNRCHLQRLIDDQNKLMKDESTPNKNDFKRKGERK